MKEGGKKSYVFDADCKKERTKKITENVIESSTQMLLYRHILRQRALVTYILHSEVENAHTILWIEAL